MSCAYHPDVEDIESCTLCERRLCADCVRRLEDKVYCVTCLVERVRSGAAGAGAEGQAEGTQATLGGENPGAAFVLGLIPGVGAIYNAEYFKAAAHILVFALLIHMADNVSGIFGLLVAGFYFYMPFEAYYTAKKHALLKKGIRLETPFDRINESFEEIEDKDWWGGVALVALGALFLLDNFNILELDQLLRLWPALLILLGVWLLKRFHGREV